MGKIIKANSLTSRGLEPSTIRRYCHMKGSPFFQEKNGGTWRVDESKFDRWLDELAQRKEIEYG